MSYNKIKVMITISKRVEYSIVFISYLANNGGKLVSLSTVARELVLPYRFLGQLTISLKKAGIIESREGKTGGYILTRDWQNKSLYDLLEALGENKHMVKCLADDSKVCIREDKCRIKQVWGRLEKGFKKELKTIKLSEI